MNAYSRVGNGIGQVDEGYAGQVDDDNSLDLDGPSNILVNDRYSQDSDVIETRYEGVVDEGVDGGDVGYYHDRLDSDLDFNNHDLDSSHLELDNNIPSNDLSDNIISNQSYIHEDITKQSTSYSNQDDILNQNTSYNNPHDDSSDDFYQVANIRNTNFPTNNDLEKIPTSSTTSDNDTYTKYTRIILWVSVISAILILIFQSFMFAVINIHKLNLESHQRYVENSIFFALFIFAAIYQVFVTIVGIYSNNLLILAALCFFYACMLIYTGIQYDEVNSHLNLNLPPVWKNATKGTNIATIVVLAITLLIQIYIVFFKLKNFVKWFSFKKIGADLNMRRMYSIFQIHRVCLIFDFFFFLGFTIQFLVIMVNDRTSPEFIITIIMLPLSIIVLVVSDFSATRELLWLSCIIVVLYCGGIVYILFKTIRLFTHYSSAYGLSIQPGDYFPGRKSLVCFAVFALILLISSIITEILIMKQYNRGLKPVVSQYYQRLPGANKQKPQPILEEEKVDTASFVID